MAEYTQITDPDLQMRVRARYEPVIGPPCGLDFRHLAHCLRALGPASASRDFAALTTSKTANDVKGNIDG